MQKHTLDHLNSSQKRNVTTIDLSTQGTANPSALSADLIKS